MDIKSIHNTLLLAHSTGCSIHLNLGQTELMHECKVIALPATVKESMLPLISSMSLGV